MANSIQQRTRNACEFVLARDKSVGPIELMVQMNFLHFSHVQQWKYGNPYYETLESHIQCGEKKLKQAWTEFVAWANEKSLEPFLAEYFGTIRSGATALKITVDGDEERETFFKTHFRDASLTDKQKQRMEDKKNKAPDLVAFQLVSKSAQCHDCSATIDQGEIILLEQQQPICLSCGDMDHLEFLPSGDATLTRRARKHSPLSAIVKRFNKSSKRYQRQGVLVTAESIDAAQAQNESDADQRARLRERASDQREKQDVKLVQQMQELIMADYPGCSPEEASAIASHTAKRGSGRVGRSAAGRSLDFGAIALAVIAWIRHQHTPYDSLLMKGIDRQTARDRIRNDVDTVVKNWRRLE